jgi:hypothetical protein
VSHNINDSGRRAWRTFVNINGVSDPVHLGVLWRRVRERYAGTDLTLDRDRLPALSGLARKVHEILHLKGTDYLAGLERARLSEELQWKRRVGPKNRRTVGYCAPSWSWAAGNGEIFLPAFGGNRDDLFEILDAETTPIEDPYGQVIGGHIRIRGLICQITMVERGHGFSGIKIFIESVVVNSHTYDFRDSHHRVYWDGDTRQGLLSHDGFSFYFLLCHLSLTDTNGLLLQRKHGRKGKFRRVGWLDFRDEGFGKDVRAASSAGMLTEDDYLDFDGVDQYTIEII